MLTCAHGYYGVGKALLGIFDLWDRSDNGIARYGAHECYEIMTVELVLIWWLFARLLASLEQEYAV